MNAKMRSDRVCPLLFVFRRTPITQKDKYLLTIHESKITNQKSQIKNQ